MVQPNGPMYGIKVDGQEIVKANDCYMERQSVYNMDHQIAHKN